MRSVVEVPEWVAFAVALVLEGARMVAELWAVTVGPLLAVAPDWVVALLIVCGVVWVVKRV